MISEPPANVVEEATAAGAETGRAAPARAQAIAHASAGKCSLTLRRRKRGPRTRTPGLASMTTLALNPIGVNSSGDAWRIRHALRVTSCDRQQPICYSYGEAVW